MLNTHDAKTRIDALNAIIKQMSNSTSHIPIAYMFNESCCSCCRSECFDLICKTKSEYKILCYSGYIKHTNICALIRCSCNEPFIWKNIIPEEKNYKNYENYENMLYVLCLFTPIKDDLWYDDCKYFFEQQQENKFICEYNEDEDEDEDENVNSKDSFGKNYDFYFCKKRIVYSE